MTPTEFIKKWRAANLKERSAAQEHFLDLCRVLGEPTPAVALLPLSPGAASPGAVRATDTAWYQYCNRYVTDT
jgi:hypothetical protein